MHGTSACLKQCDVPIKEPVSGDRHVLFGAIPRRGSRPLLVIVAMVVPQWQTCDGQRYLWLSMMVLLGMEFMHLHLHISILTLVHRPALLHVGVLTATNPSAVDMHVCNAQLDTCLPRQQLIRGWHPSLVYGVLSVCGFEYLVG